MIMKKQSGFTIVELLIVIVVIGILAAITIVSYNGIQDRAHDAVTKSDLSTAKQRFDMYQAENGTYPMSFNDIKLYNFGGIASNGVDVGANSVPDTGPYITLPSPSSSDSKTIPRGKYGVFVNGITAGNFGPGAELDVFYWNYQKGNWGQQTWVYDNSGREIYSNYSDLKAENNQPDAGSLCRDRYLTWRCG